MTRLTELVNELETKIQHVEKINAAVSKEPVGWHIQHSLLVASQIIHAVEKSNPADYQYKFNLRKFFFALVRVSRTKVSHCNISKN